MYVVGACLGALFFGHLTEKYGRKRLFMVTLPVYLVATVRRRSRSRPWFFFACRFLTGAGIGGEYAAINSAIDELMPARLRGRIDLIINGSYWLGAAAGAALTIVLLNPSVLPDGRRLAAWRSGSARCSAWPCCSCGAACRRARAGCSSTASDDEAERIVAQRRGHGRATRPASRWPRSPDDKSIEIEQRETDQLRRDRPDAAVDVPAPDRCSGCRSSSGRRSSTTRCSSPRGWC